MLSYINKLTIEFENNADIDISLSQKVYMKNHFKFYGIKTPQRRMIQKKFFSKHALPNEKNAKKIILSLWEKPQREYQYFAQELMQKYKTNFAKDDIEILEYLIVNKSWWDTIDVIATKLVGEYFKIYPEQKKLYIDKWINSKNIWLQRTTILFQLNYKQETDTNLLRYIINSLLNSNEFFIDKAIGWILREYNVPICQDHLNQHSYFTYYATDCNCSFSTTNLLTA